MLGDHSDDKKVILKEVRVSKILAGKAMGRTEPRGSRVGETSTCLRSTVFHLLVSPDPHSVPQL